MAETDELMKRLRLQNLSDIRDDGSPGEHTLMLREAADRLEALQAQVERLRAEKGVAEQYIVDLCHSASVRAAKAPPPSPSVSEEELARVIYAACYNEPDFLDSVVNPAGLGIRVARAVLSHLHLKSGEAWTVEQEREACATVVEGFEDVGQARFWIATAIRGRTSPPPPGEKQALGGELARDLPMPPYEYQDVPHSSSSVSVDASSVKTSQAIAFGDKEGGA